MSFKDLDDFFDPTLKLPVGGKTYVIAPPDAATGLWCERLMHTGMKVSLGGTLEEDDTTKLRLDDDEEQELYRRVLGDTYAELVDDGVDWKRIQHVGKTTFFWIVFGDDEAERFWNSPDPKARAKKPADRKPAKTSARPGSRGGSTTRKPARAKGTRGGSSSSTGS